MLQKDSGKVKEQTKIGIFDSGFGGLHIMRHILDRLPEYDYVFFGDTARCPYGQRSPETVIQFTEEAVEFLTQQGCRLIIAACNTVSSEAVGHLQRSNLRDHSLLGSVSVLGVIIPAAEAVVSDPSTKSVGVMATIGTVMSGKFKKEIQRRGLHINIIEKSCPLLVPFIEAGEHHSEACRLVLKEYLEDMCSHDIDTLVLGCTHYGLLRDEIRRLVGDEIRIIAEEDTVPESLETYLKRHQEIDDVLTRNATRIFFSSDRLQNFQNLCHQFYGEDIKVERVEF